MEGFSSGQRMVKGYPIQAKERMCMALAHKRATALPTRPLHPLSQSPHAPFMASLALIGPLAQAYHSLSTFLFHPIDQGWIIDASDKQCCIVIVIVGT